MVVFGFLSYFAFGVVPLFLGKQFEGTTGRTKAVRNGSGGLRPAEGSSMPSLVDLFGVNPAKLVLIEAGEGLHEKLPKVVWLFAARQTVGAEKINGGLNAPGISRRHLGITYSSVSGWRVRDLESDCGTAHQKPGDDQPTALAEDAVTLNDGDDLIIGGVARYRFKLIADNELPSLIVTLVPPDGDVARRTELAVNPADRGALLVGLFMVGVPALPGSIEIRLTPFQAPPVPSAVPDDHTIAPTPGQRLQIGRLPDSGHKA